MKDNNENLNRLYLINYLFQTHSKFYKVKSMKKYLLSLIATIIDLLAIGNELLSRCFLVFNPITL